MIVSQTSTFIKQKKKLHANQISDLDKAVKKLIVNPTIGEAKIGDLKDVRIYKFKMTKQLTLLAYTHVANEICLLTIGAHENFYRDLKKTL